MPIVKRAETSFFRLEPIVDILINPTNTSGAMGAGLALEFRNRYPDMYSEYKELCSSGRLHIGKLHIYRAGSKIIVNASTKRHWADASDLADVIISLRKIRDFLLTVPFHTVAMVVMGTGLGKLGQDEVLPHIFEILNDLPNIIHLSMRPDAFESPPKYLAIIGSRSYTDYSHVELCTCECMLEWGVTVADFAGGVSGGADGVDTCGATFFNDHKLIPIIAMADWGRYGRSAGMIRNRTIVDIATHVIALPSKKSVGTYGAISLVEKHNKENPGSPKLLKVIPV